MVFSVLADFGGQKSPVLTGFLFGVSQSARSRAKSGQNPCKSRLITRFTRILTRFCSGNPGPRLRSDRTPSLVGFENRLVRARLLDNAWVRFGAEVVANSRFDREMVTVRAKIAGWTGPAVADRRPSDTRSGSPRIERSTDLCDSDRGHESISVKALVGDRIRLDGRSTGPRHRDLWIARFWAAIQTLVAGRRSAPGQARSDPADFGPDSTNSVGAGGLRRGPAAMYPRESAAGDPNLERSLLAFGPGPWTFLWFLVRGFAAL